jgi:hypothetical protein
MPIPGYDTGRDRGGCTGLSSSSGCPASRHHGHSVILAKRNSTCLDLGSVRLALYGEYVKDVSVYDYFVYLNCGVTGLSPKWAHLTWIDLFLSKLNDEMKMTGLSLNCWGNPHIQSMMYALDRTGLEIVMRGGGGHL